MSKTKQTYTNHTKVTNILHLASKKNGQVIFTLADGTSRKVKSDSAINYRENTIAGISLSEIVSHDIISTKTDSFHLDSESFTEASIYHCDSYPVRHFDIDKSTGFARFIAPIAKVGNLVYLDEFGKPYTEFVPESTIIDSIDSFKGLPVTLNHPSEMVTASNARKYQRGMTHNTALYSDGWLWMSGSLTDDEIIKAVTSGRAKEISPGYLATVKRDGKLLIQAKRIGNHVSAVQAGRNGSQVAFKIDHCLYLDPAKDNPDIPKELLNRWV